MASPPNSQPAHRKSLAQNALSLFGAHFIGKVLSFGLIVFLPRFVSDEELGAYFVANAVTSLVGVLAELGMRDPLIRELHLRPERSAETLGVAFAFRATMSLVVLATCGLAVWVGGYTGLLANLIWLLGGAEVFNGFAQLFYMVFRARERMDYESICVLVERATVVGIGGGLVAAGTGRMSLFGAVALGAAVANAAIAGGYVIGRFSRFGPSFAWSRWRWFVGLLGPFALANILNLIYFRIDTILLERWSARSHQAVAWYGIAYSWVMALTIFPGAVMGAAFPHLARLSAPDAGGDASDALAALYRRAWKVLLSAGVPIAVVTATCAPRLMRFFYPAELYPPGTVDAALRILAWVGGLLFLSAIVSNTLRAANRRRAIVALVALTAAINVGANAWAIPRYDHVGAAASLVLSEAFFVIAGSMTIRAQVTRGPGWRFLPGIVASAAVLLGLLRLTEPLPLMAQLACSLLGYCLALWAFRSIGRDDWALPDSL